MKIKLAPGGVTANGEEVLIELAEHLERGNAPETARALRNIAPVVRGVELALSIRITVGNIEVGLAETEYREIT